MSASIYKYNMTVTNTTMHGMVMSRCGGGAFINNVKIITIL